MKKSCFLFCALISAAFLSFGTGCSPANKRERSLKAADEYYAAGDYDKAEVEYLNVVKADVANAQAISRLGLIYTYQGRIGQALAFLRRGRELRPDDLELQFKLAQFSAATGATAEAKSEALAIIDRDPNYTEAIILLASVSAVPADVASVTSHLNSLPSAKSPAVLTALGMLEARQGRPQKAEELYRQALAADPKLADAHSALGLIQLMRRDQAGATESLKTAAELSHARSPRKLQYGQYLLRTGRLEAGKEYIAELTRQTPDYLPAWNALADVSLAERKFDEASASVEKVLARDTYNLDALLLRGRIRLAQGRIEDAVTEMEKVASTFPLVPAVLFELARAQAASGAIGNAISNLNIVTARAPNHTDATQMLAALNMRKGDLGAAVVLLRRLVQQRPDLLQPRLMLADVLNSQGNAEEAIAMYRQIESDFPQNPQAPLLRALVLVQQRKFPAAREALERARSLAPDGSFPLEQLVNLDITEGKFQAARDLVQAEIKRNPKLENAGQLLIAKVYLAEKDFPAAETALKRVLDLMPDNQVASMLLAGLYNRTNQLPKALAQLEQSVARNPKDTSAQMLIGVLRDQQKDFIGAREAYEKVIAVNPRNSAALNNLAYLLSEKFGLLDKALEHAEAARRLDPQSANTADTLGWILYQKKQYPRALLLLQLAAEEIPGSAEIQMHLGMTHYVMGEEQPARQALERALQIGGDFAGIENARQALDVLRIDPEKSDAETRSRLAKIVGQRADDPMALMRLAAIEQRDGRIDEAAKSLEAALRINDRNISVLVALTRIHAIKKDTARALELAKSARKLAPDDAAIAQTLGQLAYELGDYAWAASLIQEAVRKENPSADLFFDLGITSYSVGRVDEAESALRRSLEQSSLSLSAAEAQRLLDFIVWAKDPAEAAKQSTRAAAELQRDPASVPALMVSGRAAEFRGDATAAREAYEKALARFPDFTPAKSRLAVLGAGGSSFDQRAYDLALQARTSYPADREVARALGILTYRKGDFSRAAALLREAATARPDDAELHFYLGLTQEQLKDSANAERSLRKSLELGLPAELAAQARNALEPKK